MSIFRSSAMFFRLFAALLFVPGIVSPAQNQSPSMARANPTAILIQRMAGNWDVHQRMWTGPGTEAIDLPPAIAKRKLVGGQILEEEMTLAPGASGDPFTRISCFDYNTVNSQFEYFSIDTRAPQMMVEKSFEANAKNEPGNPGPIALWGGIFVAPQLGKFKDAAFRYRIVIGQVLENRQVVQLYFTPLSGETVTEFLGFEYVYTRQP